MCYMYDGCIERCDIDDVSETVRAEICSNSTEIGIDSVFKPRRGPRFAETSLPPPVLFSGYASFAPDTGKASRRARVNGARLFNAVRKATGGDTLLAERNGPFCAEDNNRQARGKSAA